MPVLATGSTATGLAVPVLETGKGGGKAGAPAAVGERVIASGGEILDRTGAGLPTGFAVPVLETGSPGPCQAI